MTYENTLTGEFVSRPNRFIANVKINGAINTVHVKNTGRCRELLMPGARVVLQYFPDNARRKTLYDLIAVYKNNMLINIDSGCPNKAAAEFIPRCFKGVTLLRPEKTYGNSRFDFYAETADGRRIFIEVKGCTLETDGVCMFPDAPTERGLKHVRELIAAVSEGYEAYLLFVIQMCNAAYFTPNYSTHREFGEALKEAEKAGVRLLAYTCRVSENELSIDKPCKIILY